MNKFLIKQDMQLHTGKTYHHNFQGYDFEDENCIFYVWHKKEIKLIESKNLGSTMNVFYIKDGYLNIENINDNIKNGIFLACQVFSAFDEDDGKFYYFLPYFPIKLVEDKNQIFQKLGLNIHLYNSSKGVLIESGDGNKINIGDLDIEGKIGLLFGLILLYGKFENKGEILSSIKIQIPLFGQYLSIGDELINIQKQLQDNGIFIQISQNIQGDKHIYEITSNDYELLEIFSKFYLPVEKFSQINKREQTQKAIEFLKIFLGNLGDNEIINEVNNSCVKLLQKI